MATTALDEPLGMSEQDVLNCISRSVHWPMECALTPAALVHVENALNAYLAADVHRHIALKDSIRTELSNLESNIRAHLHHVIADARREPTNEDLLK